MSWLLSIPFFQFHQFNTTVAACLRPTMPVENGYMIFVCTYSYTLYPMSIYPFRFSTLAATVTASISSLFRRLPEPIWNRAQDLCVCVHCFQLNSHISDEFIIHLECVPGEIQSMKYLSEHIFPKIFNKLWAFLVLVYKQTSIEKFKQSNEFVMDSRNRPACHTYTRAIVSLLSL